MPLNKRGMISWKNVYERANELIKEYLEEEIDVRRNVGDFGIAYQQMIEIIKVVHRRNIKILILDEPTACLTDREVNVLFKMIKNLKSRGVGVVYISHRLEEVFEIGDDITVFRDGGMVGTLTVPESTYDGLISMMVGRELENYFPKEDFSVVERKESLRVENLCRAGEFNGVSFSAYTGEILGIAGLMGAGRTEIVNAIFGATKLDSGKVFLHGKEVCIKDPVQAVKAGIALLPESRKTQGLVLIRPIFENITATNLKKCLNKLKFIVKRSEHKYAEKYIDELRIATPSFKQEVAALSGGNQQKVVIAKWVFKDSEIIIFDEPTRGIDVGAKVEVYKLINKMVLGGKTVIVISSELTELMGICNRIITISYGKLTGELSPAESEDTIMKYMLKGSTG